MKRLLLLLFFLFAFTSSVSASDIFASSPEGMSHINAVLVLDVSNSMKTSDPNKLGNEAMNLFIDMLGLSGDKVGIISFTDMIQREKSLSAIRSRQDKELLKDFISQQKYGPWTDITVGLNAALGMLDDAHVPEHKTFIVLLTDGNNDLSRSNPKTLEDCDRDTERIIAQARERNWRIYTIGLNYDGFLNMPYIENIAYETGGLSFEAKTANELPDIISMIFAEQMELSIKDGGQLLADGGFQTIDIPIPDPNIVETNITLLSAKPLSVIELYDQNGFQVSFDDKNASLSQSSAYSLVKIISPAQGNWRIRLAGVDGDSVKLNYFYHYGVDIVLALGEHHTVPNPNNNYLPFTVTITEGGSPTENIALYHNSVCTFHVRLKDSEETQSFPGVFNNDRFEVEIPIVSGASYEISAVVQHPNFFRESSTTVVENIAILERPVYDNETAAPIPASAPFVITPNEGVPNNVEIHRVFGIDKAWISYLFIFINIFILVLMPVLIFLFLRRRKHRRVFTGKLIIEIIDHYSQDKQPPQYRNLIEYGNRVTLAALLNGQSMSPLLQQIVITPSPDAPSHLPQLIVKCTNPQVKLKKDFMEQDAAKGVAMPIKSELTIWLETENKQIKLRYME